MEPRTTSEKDREEMDDPYWKTRNEEKMETCRTSEKAKTEDPDSDTMEEKVQTDRGQGELMTREDITLDRIMKTPLVITAMEKGKLRAIDVFALQAQGKRCRKMTYIRSPMECNSKMMRVVWEKIKYLYSTVQYTGSINSLQGEQVPSEAGGPQQHVRQPKGQAGLCRHLEAVDRQSKKPTKKRSCSGHLGLSRPKLRGKKKRETITSEPRIKVERVRELPN